MACKGKCKERTILKRYTAEEIRNALSSGAKVKQGEPVEVLTNHERMQGFEEILKGYIDEKKK